MEKLEVAKLMNGMYYVDYYFINENKEEFSITSKFATDDIELGMVSESEEIYVSDRVLYPWEDKYTSTHGISFLMGDQLIDIRGNIEQDDMIEVASWLDFFE